MIIGWVDIWRLTIIDKLTEWCLVVIDELIVVERLTVLKVSLPSKL